MEHEWALPLTIDSICHIKKLGVVPLGVAEKFTINKKLEHYTKIRVTHDCSFPGSSGLSVNNWLLRDTLQTCFYRFYHFRILHMITAMRIEWPSKRILIVQTNLGAAYRRVHTKLQIGSTCIAIVGKLAFLCLRLPFGTTPEQ